MRIVFNIVVWLRRLATLCAGIGLLCVIVGLSTGDTAFAMEQTAWAVGGLAVRFALSWIIGKLAPLAYPEEYAEAFSEAYLDAMDDAGLLDEAADDDNVNASAPA